GLLVHRYCVPGTAQLLRRGESCRTRTYNCHFLPRCRVRRLGPNPALAKSALHNTLLVLLDGHGRLIDSQHARRFARCRADAAGKFGKVVGRVQLANGFFPASAIDEVVPIRNQIVDGTSRLAEGHAAIHAACALASQLFFRKIEVDLEPVVDALGHGTLRGQLARIFEETGSLTHVAPVPSVPVRPDSAQPVPAGLRAGTEYMVDGCG